MTTIQRKALGRFAFLGDLYDARTDQFCGTSLLTKDPPNSCVKSYDNPSVTMEVALSENISEKFTKLKVEGDLKLSVLAGLVQLGGHAEYLTDEHKSARAVTCTLLYQSTTKVESLRLSNEELKAHISLDNLINTPDATHILTEIEWGANATLSLTCNNEEDLATQEVQGELMAKLNQLKHGLSAEGKAKYETKEEGRLKTFTLKLYADVLPSCDPVPQTFDEALAYMKQIPRLLQAANDGKGKLIGFKLRPISIVEKQFKVQGTVDRIMKQMNEEAIARIVQLMDKLSVSRQKLALLYDDSNKNASCVTDEQLQDMENLTTGVNLAESNFRSELRKSLLQVRSGNDKTEILDSMRGMFRESNEILSKIELFICKNSYIFEKIRFIIELREENVLYIGKKPSGDWKSYINGCRDCYVLFLEHGGEKGVRAKNKQYFHKLIEKANKKLSKSETLNQEENFRPCFVIVDLDILREQSDKEGVRICQYRYGACVESDVLKKARNERSVCKMRTNVDKEHVFQRPNNRVEVELVCANSATGQCPKEKCLWYCEKCDQVIEYGFDYMFYCGCGRAPTDAYTCKCDSDKHGESYVPYKQTVIEELVKLISPRKEVNILVLGEISVGKSTFIKSFEMYLKYDTLEQVMKHENEAGFCKESSTPGQLLSTTDTQVYSVQYSKKAPVIRFIDTPGFSGVTASSGTEKNQEIFNRILTSVSRYEKLHGVCILLKINDINRAYIKELIGFLHCSAVNNILFCFTHRRQTPHILSEAVALLRSLLKDIKSEPGTQVVLSDHTIFSFDNESFEFPCGLSEQSALNDKEYSSYKRSWNESRQEAKRLIEHVSELQTHKIDDMITINFARKFLVLLSCQMWKLAGAMKSNYEQIEEKHKVVDTLEKYIKSLKRRLKHTEYRLVAKQFDDRMTVCTSPSCTETKFVYESGNRSSCPIPVYKKICSKFGKNTTIMLDRANMVVNMMEQAVSLVGIVLNFMRRIGNLNNPTLMPGAAATTDNTDLPNTGNGQLVQVGCIRCGCPWNTHVDTQIKYIKETIDTTDKDAQKSLELLGKKLEDIQHEITDCQTAIHKLEEMRRKLTDFETVRKLEEIQREITDLETAMHKLEGIQREIRDLQTAIHKQEKLQGEIKDFPTAIRKLEKEQETMVKAGAKFQLYLMTNSIVSCSDAFKEQIQSLIRQKNALSEVPGVAYVLKSLVTAHEIYERELKELMDARKTQKDFKPPTSAEVHQLKDELTKLPMMGAELKAIFDAATAIH